MRIGIDARPVLYGRSGIGVYVRELVGALARTFPEYPRYAARTKRILPFLY